MASTQNTCHDFKKQNMYNFWGFYELVRTVCDTLGIRYFNNNEGSRSLLALKSTTISRRF